MPKVKLATTGVGDEERTTISPILSHSPGTSHAASFICARIIFAGAFVTEGTSNLTAKTVVFESALPGPCSNCLRLADSWTKRQAEGGTQDKQEEPSTYQHCNTLHCQAL
jgi:hypothetical protein